MKTKTIGIRETIEYIALNAPITEELGDDDVGYDIMIMMAAHLFEREPKDVFEMVKRKRKRIGE